MAEGDNYTDVLLEDISSKFDRVLEVVSALSDRVDLTATKEDVEEVRSDVRIIKAAVTDHSHQLQDHEGCIVALKA